MGKTDNLTKTLAVSGTTLVFIPILAPIVFAIIALTSRGRFRFDFLMPAELFPFVLIGSGLLIYAAVRARSRRKLIIWSSVIGIVMLFGSQGLALTTGLASGEIEPAGIWWILTLGMLILFDLAVLATCVGGFLLLKDLYAQPPAAPVTESPQQ